MNHLELHAHLKIRPGKLEGFKAQAAELIRITRDQDTKTLRYDWFIKEDGTECEVHEAYPNEQGLIEHNKHIMEARRQYDRIRIGDDLRSDRERHWTVRADGISWARPCLGGPWGFSSVSRKNAAGFDLGCQGDNSVFSNQRHFAFQISQPLFGKWQP